MQFGHEQLDVYRVSIQYVAWAYEVAKNLKGVDRHARDQLLRASQSIPLNIAEGNGKGTSADRRRFFEIARGSALECASIQDCLQACEAVTVQTPPVIPARMPGSRRHGWQIIERGLNGYVRHRPLLKTHKARRC